MKKLFAVTMLVVGLAAANVGAQEKPLSFGVSVGTNLSGITSDNNSTNFDGFGWGFTAGGIMRYQITESFSVRSGVNFDYRNMAENLDISEMAIDIPVVGYYHWGRLYVGLGLSIGIPFGHDSELDDTFLKSDRASLDVGYTGGIGFMITPNLAIDLRGNSNFTKMYSSGPMSNFDIFSHTESITLIYYF